MAQVTFDFSGRVALVTGAGSGIGAATGALLAASGATVAFADLDADAAAARAEAAGGGAIGIGVDVADAASVDAMVARVVDELGGLHLAVNNAGVPGPMTPVKHHPADEWQAVIDVNLTGVFHCLKAELSVLGDGGAVVNVASVLASVVGWGKSAYVAAKHGVVGLTRTAAVETASKGVRVNAVAPGFIETPMFSTDVGAQQRSGIERLTPQGRLGETEEIALAIAWLLSDAAAFVTGAVHTVDGGYTLG